MGPGKHSDRQTQIIRFIDGLVQVVESGPRYANSLNSGHLWVDRYGAGRPLLGLVVC